MMCTFPPPPTAAAESYIAQVYDDDVAHCHSLCSVSAKVSPAAPGRPTHGWLQHAVCIACGFSTAHDDERSPVSFRHVDRACSVRVPRPREIYYYPSDQRSFLRTCSPTPPLSATRHRRHIITQRLDSRTDPRECMTQTPPLLAAPSSRSTESRSQTETPRGRAADTRRRSNRSLHAKRA